MKPQQKPSVCDYICQYFVAESMKIFLSQPLLEAGENTGWRTGIKVEEEITGKRSFVGMKR